MQGVSVIICCYNSSKRLPETLKHLSLQVVPNEISWEVIIVNNASKDNTVEAANCLWRNLKCHTPFRVVEEEKPGLANAREKGLQLAKYDFCIFCDDDNWLQRDYVRISFETMKRDNLIGVLGGRGEALCEIAPPTWFEKNKKSYAVGCQAVNEGDITKSYGVVYGAGSVINKKIYFSIINRGFKSFLIDRKGLELSTGHDYEICYSMALSGYKIYYNPKLSFKHFIPKERLTRAYLLKLKKGVFSARPVLSLYKYRLQNPEILKKSFLWQREISYSFINELLNKELMFPYTLELLKKRRLFRKAFYHIKSLKS